MMMKYTRVSLLLKAVAIGLLVALGVALLGWDSGPSPHEVYVCVIPYEKAQDYEHYLVPYSTGMTIRDAVTAAIKKRGLPSVDESEMAPIIDRHIVWTWSGVCRRVLDALTDSMQMAGLEDAPSAIMLWEREHGLDNPHGLRVDAEHSLWNSEARPNDFIRVFTRDELAH